MKFYDDYYNDLLCITDGILNSDINTKLDYRVIADNQYNKITARGKQSLLKVFE